MADRLEAAEHLSCREFTELASDYREGTLSAHVRSLFEEHLAFCDGCDRYVAQLEAAGRVLARLDDVADGPPAAPSPALLAEFRRARGPS